MKYIPLILSGVALNAIAQLLLKKGMTTIGFFEFNLPTILHTVPQLLNTYVIAGLISYVVSVGLWLLVLSRVEVSYAYPFLSIGYILTAAIGYFYFNEAVTWERLAGVALICTGVVFIART